MSLTGKGRFTRALDPESSDRIQGRLLIAVTGQEVDIDMPYISHVWGNFYVGGVEYGIKLPYHFRNVIQLFSYESYDIEHTPVGHWVFQLSDSTSQELSEVDEIARIAIEAGKLGHTLIHCQAGMNRSCLVMSRVLQMNGFTARESVDMIREKRTKYALCNPEFERWTLETPVHRGREEA